MSQRVRTGTVTDRGRALVRQMRARGVKEIPPEDVAELAWRVGCTSEYMRKLVNGVGLAVKRHARSALAQEPPP